MSGDSKWSASIRGDLVLTHNLKVAGSNPAPATNFPAGANWPENPTKTTNSTVFPRHCRALCRRARQRPEVVAWATLPVAVQIAAWALLGKATETRKAFAREIVPTWRSLAAGQSTDGDDVDTGFDILARPSSVMLSACHSSNSARNPRDRRFASGDSDILPTKRR